MKTFEMTIVRSSEGGERLSVRHKGSASAVKLGLKEAGFEPGERVVLISLEDFMNLTLRGKSL